MDEHECDDSGSGSDDTDNREELSEWDDRYLSGRIRCTRKTRWLYHTENTRSVGRYLFVNHKEMQMESNRIPGGESLAKNVEEGRGEAKFF